MGVLIGIYIMNEHANAYCLRMSKLSFVRMRCFLNSHFHVQEAFSDICEKHTLPFDMNTRN